MPQERQDHCQDSQQHRQGREEYTDLGGLASGDKIGGKILERLLKFFGTGRRIILTAGHVRDLGQRFFINISTKTAPSSQSTSAKLRTKPSPSAKWIVALTIHGRTVICRPKSNGIHPNMPLHRLLRSRQRQWTSVACTICQQDNNMGYKVIFRGRGS